MVDYALDRHLVLLFTIYKIPTNSSYVRQFLFIMVDDLFLLLSFAALLHPENPLYATIACSLVEALRVVELPRHEYLLVFGTLAAYVDRHGRKSRDREIMYPAVPTAIGKLFFSLNPIFIVFEIHKIVKLLN